VTGARAPTRVLDPETRARHDLGEGAWIELVPELVPDHAARMDALLRTLPLAPEKIVIVGRELETPRLTSWHGDPGACYRYSGRTFEPEAWTAELADVRDRLDAALGVRFNAVLVNHYRDGRDSMGFHADDEPELGPAAPDDVLIASVSLGAARRFVMRHRRRGDRLEVALGAGALLVMGGRTQRRWQHGVPKTRVHVGARTSLTFRIVRR